MKLGSIRIRSEVKIVKIDADLKEMSLGQLRQEVMRLRRAFRKELGSTGDRRCWINLFEVLPEGKQVRPLELPEKEFLANCARYHKRNQK